MGRFKKFLEFKNISLNENMGAARDLAIKKFAQGVGVDVSEISPDTVKKILSSKKFELVKQLSEGTPNYALLYAQMVYLQDMPQDKGKKIKELISKYKAYLEMLPESIMKYGKIVVDENDRRPGWERLETDLENLEQMSVLMKAAQDFRPAMKEQLKKSPREVKEELSRIIQKIIELEDKPGVNKENNPITRNAYKEFLGMQRKYIDTNTYPEFADPEVAFASLIKDAKDKIKSWNIKEETEGEYPKVPDYVAESIEECGPGAKILYYDKGFFAISARTNEAVAAIASDTTWCIKEKGTFNNVTINSVQLCIMNMNLPDYDPWSLTGWTVSENNKIIDSATRPNQPFSGNKNVWEVMKEKKFPAELIDACRSSFSLELKLKSLINNIFSGTSNTNKKGLVSAIITFITSDEIVEIESKSEENNLDIIMGIMEKEIAKYSKEAVEKFADDGIVSSISLKMFNSYIRKFCTSSDMEKIKEQSIQNLEDSEVNVKILKKSAKTFAGLGDVLRFSEKTLEAKDEILKYFSVADGPNLINQ